MENQTILKYKKDILQRLSKRQLKEAIELLIQMSVNLQDWQISEKLSELDTNYKFMLHYLFEGTNDPEQENMYMGFIRTLYELTDEIADSLLIKISSNFFFEKSRMESLKEGFTIPDYEKQLQDIAASFSLLELLEEGERKKNELLDLEVKRERAASGLFNSVFVSPAFQEQQIEESHSFLSAQEINAREKSLFVSALTLSLFHRFDSRKIRVLMTACLHPDIQVSQRAIVGLIILLQMYDVRWEYYADCKQQLETLSENLYFKNSVVTVIKQLIRSRETEKISKKLTEEIIPEMLRFNSLAGKKLNMEELMGGDIDFSEKNPEWKKELENSGLADKLQEYSNLQMEGADVFHSTFSQLKHFPFFRDLENWFMPFDSSYSTLQPLFKDAAKDSLLNTAILHSGHMCNSDKYSFAFSLLQLPESQRQMMLQRFGAESEELKQLQKEAKELSQNINEEVISNQYIQDLYRFFKLFPARNSFMDIFKLKLNFYEKKSIAPLISGEKEMRQIAQYCFDKNFFAEALNIYLLLVSRDGEAATDSDIWQKIGYCRQMLEDNNGALEAYLQADLILPDNTWTIRRIAHLYRSEKKPQEALVYYLKLQNLQPENLSHILNTGHCYLEMKEYEQALNTYFKAEIQSPDNTKTWRPIAWTAFIMEKFSLAQSYYNRIVEEDKPTVHDFINAGHVELAMNDKKMAVQFYLKSLSKLENNLDEFYELFLSDKEILTSLGVNENLFALLFDELRYKLD